MTLQKIILALAMIPLFSIAFFHSLLQSKGSVQKIDSQKSNSHVERQQQENNS